jgi:3-dehydroquinate synthetase
MVDSSVGGKTGFDHPAGKNLLGAFFQPSRVHLDLEHLTTLPPRERAAGLAEVVKIALVRDAGFLARLEVEADAIAAGDRAALRDVVREAVRAKMRVVREDEHETGVRALLNLGHTLGHALEAHGGYARWLHGEAVAIGTVLELRAAERMGLTPAGTAERAAALLSRCGLPTTAPPEDVAAALPFIGSDKKRTRSAIKLPIVAAPGVGRVERLEIDALGAALASLP